MQINDKNVVSAAFSHEDGSMTLLTGEQLALLSNESGPLLVIPIRTGVEWLVIQALLAVMPPFDPTQEGYPNHEKSAIVGVFFVEEKNVMATDLLRIVTVPLIEGGSLNEYSGQALVVHGAVRGENFNANKYQNDNTYQEELHPAYGYLIAEVKKTPAPNWRALFKAIPAPAQLLVVNRSLLMDVLRSISDENVTITVSVDPVKGRHSCFVIGVDEGQHPDSGALFMLTALATDEDSLPHILGSTMAGVL